MDLGELGCFTFAWQEPDEGELWRYACCCGYESMPLSERQVGMFRILHEKGTARPEPLLGMKVPDD